MSDTAILLAHGLLESAYAKTSHGLIRGPSRYRIGGVVDPLCAGRDAGEVLDGQARDIPVAASVTELLDGPAGEARFAVVGVASAGGVLSDEIRGGLFEAARAGLHLVNGLHALLSDDAELMAACAASGAEVIDVRRPPPVRELHFWSGEILQLSTPRVAVLGTDCSVGKRTTAVLLQAACRARGIATEVIYTGQTGWLQGLPYGFVFDAIPNDFVSGELEHAILRCAREARPDLMLIEGQASLRNPSGPCGAEFLVSGGARGVILQHVPGRELFEGWEELGLRIPPIAGDAELVRRLGGEVWALTLNDAGLDPERREPVRQALAAELGVPAVYPLSEGVDAVVDVLIDRLELEARRA